MDMRGPRAEGRGVARWVALTGALFLIATAVRAQDVGLPVGSIAPDAVVQTLEGKDVKMSKFVGKTPTVIEFWATWCPNCKELEPTLKTAHAKYAKQVAFVTIAVSINQSVARVKAYKKKYGIPGEVYFDTKGNASGAYDAPATSYVLVLDKTGKVVYTGLGGKQNLDAAIRKAIAPEKGR